MAMLVLVFFAITGTIHAIPSGSPSLSLLSSYSVNEGQTITLRCSVSQNSRSPDPITWHWLCADDDLTANSTDDGGGTSTLRFTADRKYDKQSCYCRAVSRDSLNLTYDKTSSYRTIDVKYTPRSSPIINTSNIALVSGGEAVLSCSIDSIGNPAISWSWKCGTQSMYTRVQKRGRTTEVVIPAEQRLDGLSCYCTAQASGFQASSKPALVSVRYIPSDYPQISRTATSVSVGSPVVLRCSLSSAGNPPVTWSWFCNDVMVNKGVNQMGKSTELSFLAEQNDDKKGCYCRAKNSLSVTGRYDEKSSDSYIRIIGTPIVSSVRQSEKGGISPVAFGVTLAFLLVVIVTCLVVIVIQHKRIPKESSLTSWFLVKIGRRSNLESQIQDTKCTIEEHNYEVLTTGNQSKDADERVPTYQNLRVKRGHKQRPAVVKNKELSVIRS